MKSKSEWVNFREIREKVSIEDILKHYVWAFEWPKAQKK